MTFVKEDVPQSQAAGSHKEVDHKSLLQSDALYQASLYILEIYIKFRTLFIFRHPCLASFEH